MAALYCCVILLAAWAVLPALPAGRALVTRVLGRRGRPFLVLAAWVLPYLVYAAGCGDFRWSGLARLLALCVPPLAIYCVLPPRNPAALSWQDAIAWSWLVLAVVLRRTGGIWNVPANLDFMARLAMIAVASWSWVFVRPVAGLGYRFSLSRQTVRAAAINFAGFAICGLPLAFALRFAGWNPRWHGMAAFAAGYIEILVFIAWLEELFFRGFLQSLLSARLGSPARGHLAASLAFGLSHILLGAAPNWRYVAMATLAGWFYGRAFRQSGNLTGPTLTHALVDAAWRSWFGLG